MFVYLRAPAASCHLQLWVRAVGASLESPRVVEPAGCTTPAAPSGWIVSKYAAPFYVPGFILRCACPLQLGGISLSVKEAMKRIKLWVFFFFFFTSGGGVYQD